MKVAGISLLGPALMLGHGNAMCRPRHAQQPVRGVENVTTTRWLLLDLRLGRLGTLSLENRP